MLTCILPVFFISACQPVQQQVIRTTVGESFPEPTSIVLYFRTPVPTPIIHTTPTLTPTPDAGANDLPDYYGGLVITMDNVGETLIMRPQGGFLLRLGEEFQWDVTLSPADVITLNTKAPLEPGEQGVFIARKRGRVVLQAVGEPVCLQNDPPCALPAVLFQMYLLVE